MQPSRFGKIFVTADDPAFLEEQVEPATELFSIGEINVRELRDEYIRRQKNYDTTPFDQEGRLLRLFPGGVSIWSGFPGAGKCLGKGTPVLYADGTIRSVEDVRFGDLLMGPDSKSRQVRGIARGHEMLYRVTPVKGIPYVVNESHILSLKRTGTEEITNISVRDYLAKSPGFRERMKGWRTGVTWSAKDVPLDPYYLGIWLGDGSADSPQVWKPDEEVLSACVDVAVANGLTARRREYGTCPSIRISGVKGAPNAVTEKLRGLGVLGNKHVPLIYRANTRAVRLEILAGLLDTDGALSSGGYDFVSAIQRLAEDVAFLARSLGFAAYVSACMKSCQTGATGEYWRVSISGDCSVIPLRISRKQAAPRRQIKDVLKTGIHVEAIGEGEYFGFELSGDGLFLLGDFTVTHNTTLLRQLVCHLMHKRNGVFLASLEEEPMDVFYRLACVALGTNDPSEDGLQWCVDYWCDRLRLWAGSDTASSAHLLAAIRVLARDGIRHAVIDSLMCLDVHNGDWEGQRQFANAMRRTARSSGAHIHLVAHPRKPLSPDQEPDLNDVAGAREIGGLADNVLFVRRNPTAEVSVSGQCTPMKVKISKQRYYTGALGEITGWFHRERKQFKVDQFDESVTPYLPQEAYGERKTADAWWDR